MLLNRDKSDDKTLAVSQLIQRLDMFLMRFTERAYTNYTEEEVRNSLNSAVRLTFSNSHFDPYWVPRCSMST